MVAQQRVTKVFAGASKFRVGPEESQRMVNRHDGQILARHFGNQAAPDARTNHDMIRRDYPARSHNAFDAAIFNDQRFGSGVGERLKSAGLFRHIDELAGNRLRARCHKTCIRVPQTALHH